MDKTTLDPNWHHSAPYDHTKNGELGWPQVIILIWVLCPCLIQGCRPRETARPRPAVAFVPPLVLRSRHEPWLRAICTPGISAGAFNTIHLATRFISTSTGYGASTYRYVHRKHCGNLVPNVGGHAICGIPSRPAATSVQRSECISAGYIIAFRKSTTERK